MGSSARGRRAFRAGRLQRRRRRQETRRGGESGAVCVLLEKRMWGRESVCASSVTDRGEVWLGIVAGGVERQTAGATRWTGGERVRCARVCESSTSSTKGGDSACRSWVSVCVVGRGRGAPEKREEQRADQETPCHAPRFAFAVNRCSTLDAPPPDKRESAPRHCCFYLLSVPCDWGNAVNRCSTRGPPPDTRESALRNLFESINHINLPKPL